MEAHLQGSEGKLWELVHEQVSNESIESSVSSLEEFRRGDSFLEALGVVEGREDEGGRKGGECLREEARAGEGCCCCWRGDSSLS